MQECHLLQTEVRELVHVIADDRDGIGGDNGHVRHILASVCRFCLAVTSTMRGRRGVRLRRSFRRVVTVVSWRGLPTQGWLSIQGPAAACRDHADKAAV
jgi:hypothetical protein